MEVPYDERKLENILRTPWASDGKNFSQRIWKDRTQLVNNLQKHLSESVIRGDSDTDMIQALSKDEKKAEFNTRRLVETESAFFDSESERQCCEDFGIEKYRFLAVLDMKTSDICQELDNKVFLEKERQVGVNAPPMHPFCRSTTAPVVDEDFLTSRRAKNPKTGEYDEIPSEMNYKQWKEKYFEGKENLEEVKAETSRGTGSSGAEIKIESPKVESEYKETPIPSREEKFDSNAYEERVNNRANKQAVNVQAEPATIETERPVNYGNTEKIYSDTAIPKEVKERRVELKKKSDNFIENLEKKIDSKEITKELADETQNLIKEIQKQTDEIVNELAKTTSTIQEGKNSSGVLENLASSALLNSEEKISGALNPKSKEADKHAELYYKSIRKMKTDVKNIAKNTGYSIGFIQEIKNYLFIDEQDLGDGVIKRFDPDFSIAESWKRLMIGKDIKPHDLTLLKHEAKERELVKQGYTQDEAHILTSEIYNYSDEADLYYGSIKKHK